MQHILSVDVGTTALKCTLLDTQGKTLISSSQEYPLIVSGQSIQQDPHLWWDAFCATSHKILEKYPNDTISAVVLSGQMQDLLCLDNQDELVGPTILYSDTSSQTQFLTYSEEFGIERAQQITKNNPDAASLPPKLLKIQATHQNHASFTYLLGAHDYICWKLTDQKVTDLTNAATTGLLDYEANSWSKEILTYLEIDSTQLPRLELAPAITGNITEEAAQKSGLLVGTPVIHGSGDAASSTLGVGAGTEGRFSCYLGTSGWIAATLPTTVDQDIGVFNLRHPNGKSTITIGAMRTTGGNISWVLDLFNVEEDPYSFLQENAKEAAVGSGGVFFLPYLQGERMPFNNPFARGALVGMSRDTSKKQIFRAVIEGVAFGLATIYRILSNTAIQDTAEVVISGGGAENDLLAQTLADVLGITVSKVVDAPNAGNIGNYLIAMNALGLRSGYDLPKELQNFEKSFMPNKENHEYYAKALPIFERLYQGLATEFCEIAHITSGQKGAST